MQDKKMETHQPWVEKYRPRQVSDVAYQEEVIRTLTNTLETGNLPHLLFYGPPGTGKTTTALAISRQLFGPELYKSRVLELNASDDRGIKIVRTKIKDFASVAVGSGVSGYPSPPFKIIILDEADSMTEDAQNALRRTMETHSKVTRFIFICNYVSRIIEPLASRCAKFRFRPLIREIMNERINFICEKEGISLHSEALSGLSEVSDGDLRRAITILQSAARLYGSNISRQQIINVSGVVPSDVIRELFQNCAENSFDSVQSFATKICLEGYPVSRVLSQYFDVIAVSEDVKEDQKAKISEVIAEADKNLIDGADEFLQLLNVASSSQRILNDLPIASK